MLFRLTKVIFRLTREHFSVVQFLSLAANLFSRSTRFRSFSFSFVIKEYLQAIRVVVTTLTVTLTMTTMMDNDVEYRYGDHDNIACLSFAVFFCAVP